jgi:hypothetical protein
MLKLLIFTDLRKRQADALFVNFRSSCTGLFLTYLLIYMTPYGSIFSVSNICRLDFITRKIITIYINTVS